MTLEEYKNQCKAIKEEMENFNGSQEEAIEFLEDLATKYPEVNEFNTKTLHCKDVTEFKHLADSVGMKFSNDDSAEKLYSFLNDDIEQMQLAPNTLEDGIQLDDDVLADVRGGGVVIISAGALASWVLGAIGVGAAGAAIGKGIKKGIEKLKEIL